MNIVLLVLLISCRGVLVIFGKSNYCQKTVRGESVTFCCNNSEKKKNGKCTPCKTGFISIDGENCKKCALPNFGRKCIGVCSCNVNQICDHVYGCLEEFMSTHSSSRRDIESTIEETRTTGYSSIDDRKGITHRTHTVGGTSESYRSTNLDGLRPVYIAVNNGLSDREVLVYSLGSGGFLLVIIACTVCLLYKRRTNHVTILSNERDANNGDRHAHESPYDYIEENELLDLIPSPVQIRTNRLTIQSLETDTKSSIESDGYLKPIPDDQDIFDSSSSSNSYICDVDTTIHTSNSTRPYLCVQSCPEKPHNYTKFCREESRDDTQYCACVKYLDLVDVNSLLTRTVQISDKTNIKSNLTKSAQLKRQWHSTNKINDGNTSKLCHFRSSF